MTQGIASRLSIEPYRKSGFLRMLLRLTRKLRKKRYMDVSLIAATDKKNNFLENSFAGAYIISRIDLCKALIRDQNQISQFQFKNIFFFFMNSRPSKLEIHTFLLLDVSMTIYRVMQTQ